MDIMLINEECEHSGGPLTPSVSASRLLIIAWKAFYWSRWNLWPRSSDSSEVRRLPQDFVPAMTASVPLTAVQVTDADLLEIQRKTKSWTLNMKLLSPEVLKKWQFSIVNMLLDFFLIPVSPHHAGSCGILPSLYTKRSCLRQHSKESSAVKVTRLLWHYCAAQMQGFSIFLTAWQTHSNP